LTLEVEMNTAEIEEFLKSTKGFQGVFSSDRLPSEPRLLVCNTDPIDAPDNTGSVSMWTYKDAENTLIRLDNPPRRLLNII
jgi:hypothetical protein